MVKQADVPEGTIDEVKDWVNADESESEARAKKALEVENKREGEGANDGPRSSLVEWLEAKSGVPADERTSAGGGSGDDEAGSTGPDAQHPGVTPDQPEDIDSDLSEEEQARLDEDEISHNTHPAGDVGPADFSDPAADGTGEQADADLEAESTVAYREGNVFRTGHNEVGTKSDSAYNAKLALGISQGEDDDEWDEDLDEAIKSYQQDHGQPVTGRLTRDQARRLKLSWVG